MINRLENVQIDNTNQAFGGYIYSVSYNVGIGGDKTTLKVRLINEAGDYNIDGFNGDLKTMGAPTEIKIGNKITFYGYPFQYRFEKSAAGKILEVEYEDESGAYLDLKWVALTGRIEAAPDNIIVLGRPFISKYAMGENLQLELAAQNELYLDLEDQLKVPSIMYNFPELLAAIGDILGTVPVLTSDHTNFYREYVGTLREVLSSWCSDLGLSFYWQDRKLNFIDLRNPDTFEVIRTRVNEIIGGEKTESVDETVTLRDTFVRANNSLFLRDGEIAADTFQRTGERFRFNVLRLNDILGIKEYYGTSSLLSSPHIDRIKAGKFGSEVILLSLIKNASTGAYIYFPDDPSIACIAVIRLDKTDSSGSPSSVAQYNAIKTEADIFFEASQNYIVYRAHIRKDDQGELALPANYKDAFDKFTALANVMARFYYFRMGKSQFDEQFTNNGQVKWYGDITLFRETPIGKALADFSSVIPNYNTITIRGFIQKDSNLTINTIDDFGNDQTLNDDGTRTITNGYAITEAEPTWLPGTLEEIYSPESVFLFEPKSDSTGLIPKTFYVGVQQGSLDTDEEALDAVSLEKIQPPREEGLDVYGVPRDPVQISSVQLPFQFVKTTYPEDFTSAQVSRIEVNTSNLPEELIISQGAPGDGIDDLIQANFLAAHNQYTAPLSFAQSKPFFTKTFTVPYVDLEVTPKAEEGFQSLDISFDSNGLNATYTYGTSQMKVPNPDFYLATTYDNRQKRVLPFLTPKIVVNFRGANRIR